VSHGFEAKASQIAGFVSGADDAEEVPF